MAVKEGNIEVSKKTLLHISEGIYRSEGGSIKELISNAFDAKASEVIINMNYPTFDILTCQDNGEGMTEDEFIRIVTGGIGDSPKATLTESERPIIGKLGIGILAIAQVCRSFTIISHHEKTKTAFKGSMIFRTDVDKVAKDKNVEKDSNNKSYQIGKYKLEEKLEYNPNKKGVLVFTKDLRQAYMRRFRDSDAILNSPKNDSPLNFETLVDYFYDNRNVKELGPYYELIWELCQLSPLPYYNSSPIRDEYLDSISKYNSETKIYSDGIKFLKAKQKEIESYNFSVIFDDIKLYRPIKLPSPVYRFDKLQESQIFYFEYDNKVRGRDLKFQFYCIAQECAILPMDLKGIQVRIKNVGIGLNDATFLKFGKNESPRDNWIYGEIYVEKGLDSALNIDRDSFNENDEHYFIVREKIHEFLKEEVFTTVKSLQRKRNQAKKTERERIKAAEMKKELRALFKSINYIIKFEGEIDNLEVDQKNKTIVFPEAILFSLFSERRAFFSASIIELLPVFQSKTRSKETISNILDNLSSILLD